MDRRTRRLVAIIMSDGFGLPLFAKFGVRVDNPSLDHFWEPATEEFISTFLNENFEVYEYDPHSEDDELPLAAGEPSDEIDWEIPPVQYWVKGQELNRDQVDRVSHFLGFGSGFIAEEIMAASVHSEDSAAPTAKPSAPKTEETRCLWCLAPADRRYNFNRDEPLSEFDVEGFEKPVIWSDGVVTEQGDKDASQLFPNHYGDCVIACSECGAMFLASTLEKKHPRVHWYPDHEDWDPGSQLIAEGSCHEGANEYQEARAVLTWSEPSHTVRYLKQAQSESLINWGEWTALQQVVNWLADEDRQAKLGGVAVHFSDTEELKEAVRKFIDRVGQIKAGTLGGMAPFRQMHSERGQDENFFVHNYEVQEALPVANMLRILGATGPDFGWATPSHPGIAEAEVTRTGWSEFDQWIALRGKAIIAASEKGITDWVVAVDASGNLIDWG